MIKYKSYLFYSFIFLILGGFFTLTIPQGRLFSKILYQDVYYILITFTSVFILFFKDNINFLELYRFQSIHNFIYRKTIIFSFDILIILIINLIINIFFLFLAKHHIHINFFIYASVNLFLIFINLYFLKLIFNLNNKKFIYIQILTYLLIILGLVLRMRIIINPFEYLLIENYFPMLSINFLFFGLNCYFLKRSYDL